MKKWPGRDPNKQAFVHISDEMLNDVLRAVGIPEDEWKDFRGELLLRYVGKKDYVFSSVARTDE